MSLPRYASYKESGLDWFGEVPGHWKVSKIKEVIRSIESGVSVNATDVPAGEGAIGVLKTSCVYDGTFRYTENKAVLDDDLVRVACPVEKGTLIVSRMNTPALVGAAGLVEQSRPNIYLPDRLWQVHFRDCSPSFVHYWTLSRAYRAQVEVACSGTSSSMQNLGQDQFKSFWVSLPVEAEQSAIAAFLDRETGKIDALIAEQEKLLTLLAEKRQATISRAVTRGLIPNAPMKDSGVPWLGEVPAHWQMKKLKHVKAKTVNAFVDGPFGSNLKSEHFIEGGDVYVIESNFATQGRLEPTGLKTISKEHFATIRRSEVVSEDIVIAKIGAYFGKAAILPFLDRQAVVSGNSMKLTVDDEMCSTQWILWQLTNLKASGEIDLLANGSAQPALSLGGMNELPILVPTLAEQSEILFWLDSSIDKIGALTCEADHAVGLLKERRSALIAAAVTGMIDVRQTI